MDVLTDHMEKMFTFCHGKCFLFVSSSNIPLFKNILFIYFLDRGKGREKEMERKINVWLPLTQPTTGNLACNPGMCLRLGIKRVTLWLAGWHSTHWATPARTKYITFKWTFPYINMTKTRPPLFPNFISRLLDMCSLEKVLFFKEYFIDYVITVVPFFSPLYPPLSCTLHPSSILPRSSCPCVVLISSLASLFSILFLTSPRLFCTYQLCFLFPIPFHPILALLLPTPHFK